MKINLLYNSDDIRSGYVNVDPFAINSPQKICCDLQNLSFCSPNEAEEILCLNILNKYEQRESANLLRGLLGKLHHEGTLTISGVNTYEVARQYVTGKINLEKYNEITYQGSCGLNYDDIINFLKNNGHTILEKKLDGFYFVIKSRRA